MCAAVPRLVTVGPALHACPRRIAERKPKLRIASRDSVRWIGLQVSEGDVDEAVITEFSSEVKSIARSMPSAHQVSCSAPSSAKSLRSLLQLRT